MSKAILVTDMPSGCVKCNFYAYAISRCNLKDKFQNDISNDFKPEWCPLKPMPEKKAVMNHMDDEVYLFRRGFNACIDAICGKE